MQQPASASEAAKSRAGSGEPISGSTHVQAVPVVYIPSLSCVVRMHHSPTIFFSFLSIFTFFFLLSFFSEVDLKFFISHWLIYY